MSEPANTHVLYVVVNGRVIGDIQRTGKRRIRLRYDDVASAGFTPLSVSMPGVVGRRYRENVLEPWLGGLLPDRPETLRQWRRRFATTDLHPIALLQYVGEDVAGAAQFVRPERLDVVLAGEGDLQRRSSSEVAEMLRRARADLPVSLTDGAQGKFSLAGAQAKIALHQTARGWSDPSGSIPSTHILKPAIPGMDDQDLVEHVTMRTAAGLGLRVATTDIEHFEDDRALVVSRYDRARRHDKWLRVHQEDMCQALALSPTRKYESQGGPSAADVANLIRAHSSAPEQDAQRFAQALIFNWLICGTDAHARNYSLLLSGPQVRLAPLYDLNTHLAYSDGIGNDLSMSTSTKYRASTITISDWMRYAPALHVDPEWVRHEVVRQGGAVLETMAQVIKEEGRRGHTSHVLTRLLRHAEIWTLARTGHPTRMA